MGNHLSLLPKPYPVARSGSTALFAYPSGFRRSICRRGIELFIEQTQSQSRSPAIFGGLTHTGGFPRHSGHYSAHGLASRAGTLVWLAGASALSDIFCLRLNRLDAKLVTAYNKTMKLKVIEASIRQGRLGERVTKWVTTELDTAAVSYELLDLKEHQLPFLDTPTPPHALNKAYQYDEVKAWSAKIDDGDAYIIITPEYNHGYPAVLKNAIDWLYPEWYGKPIAFISYSDGPVGGARVVEQLRQVISNFNMYDIRSAISIGRADKLLDENGATTEPAFGEQLGKMVQELGELVDKLS